MEDDNDNDNCLLNQITLECLMNSTLASKWKTGHLKADNEQEYRFYRKRILHLVKQMLISNKSRNDVGKDISKSFRIFIKLVIEYFKMVDTTEFYQKEYIDMSLNEFNPECSEYDISVSNQLIMRQKTETRSTMDDYVQIQSTTENSLFLPQKRKINLKESQFKNKGLGKKKNLSNNYVEIKTSEIVQTETQNGPDDEKETKHC